MKCWNALTAFALCVCLAGIANAEELDAQSVWTPEVEELYEFQASGPSWLAEESSELTVARGVKDSEQQSALSIAIRDLILPRMIEDRGSPLSEHEETVATAEIVRRLYDSEMILEEFEQPFYKVVDGERYEAFTREALLLDLSEGNLQYLYRKAGQAIKQNEFMRNNTQRASIGVVGTLFVLCWFAYWILDRLTKGYYVGLLRLMTATVFLVSAGLTIHVARVILSSL